MKAADSLAGLGIITEGQPLDHAAIINNIRDIGKVEDFGESESTSISKLNDLGVKISIARNECY